MGYLFFWLFIIFNLNKESKLKKLIEAKYKENNFLENHINNLTEKIDNVPEDIFNLIKSCTSNKIELRPSFNDIFNFLNDKIKPLIKDSNNTKDIFHDYSFYQLSKYNDDLILQKEILTNQKLKNVFNDINSEYNIKLKESDLGKYYNEYSKK